MGKPKTVDDAFRGYQNAAATVGTKWAAGISVADWATPAGSDLAEANWAQRIQEAIGSKRRQAMIRLVTNSQWQTITIAKGQNIIGQRMTLGADKFRAKWGPIYSQVIAGLGSLPPRTGLASQNLLRVTEVVKLWKQASGRVFR